MVSINTTISVNCLRYYWIVFGECGAERGTRTPTTFRSVDFESTVSTNFTISATDIIDEIHI